MNGKESHEVATYHGLTTAQCEGTAAAAHFFVVEGKNPLVEVAIRGLSSICQALAVCCRDDVGGKVFVGIVEKVARTDRNVSAREHDHLYNPCLLVLPFGPFFAVDVHGAIVASLVFSRIFCRCSLGEYMPH